MTDFLKRVSQMALGLTPLVQPLVVSRYAASPQLLAPEMLLTEERTVESDAEQPPKSDAENLSPSSRHSSTADPIRRRVPEQTAESRTQRESEKPLLHNPSATEAARSAFLERLDVSQTKETPFDASASQTNAYLNTQDLTGPDTNGVTVSTVEAQIRRTPSADELEQLPSLTIHDGEELSSHSKVEPVKYVPMTGTSGEEPARRHGTLFSHVRGEAERSATQTMDVRGTPPHRADDANSPPTAYQEGVTFGADTSVGVNESKRGSQEMTVSISEPIGRRHSLEDSFAQGASSEFDIETHEMNAASITLRSGSNALIQSRRRPDDSQLFSSQEGRAANTSSEQVIRVTIGRIEVRAVTPPLPPVESSAPPAPKLSLDEYLRLHNGRAR